MFSRRHFTFIGPALVACSRSIERRVLDAVNAVRVGGGVPALEWHPGAASAAASHSRAMAERGFFSHDDPQRGELDARMSAAGVQWRAIAENLFQQRGCPDAVRCAVESWLDSPGHKRNLLNAGYTHTGIGIHAAADGTLYYTQIFLRAPD